ncbi:hypothetical protein ElyMa_003182100, partial [Elysia marginata]
LPSDVVTTNIGRRLTNASNSPLDIVTTSTGRRLTQASDTPVALLLVFLAIFTQYTD